MKQMHQGYTLLTNVNFFLTFFQRLSYAEQAFTWAAGKSGIKKFHFACQYCSFSNIVIKKQYYLEDIESN
jgi:hypothetical protein